MSKKLVKPICKQCGRNDNYKERLINMEYLRYSTMNHNIPHPISQTYVCNCGQYTTVMLPDEDPFFPEEDVE